MKYVQVIAKRDGDNREYCAVYFGISTSEALQRHEKEFPEHYKNKSDWTITAKTTED